MSIAELLLPEFERECAVSRTILERVREDRADWKPHEKAFSLAHLAQLVAMLPGWMVTAATQDEIDFAPKGGASRPGYSNKPTAELLAIFDKGVAEGRAALARVNDAQMREPWSTKASGEVLSTQPRYDVIRMMTLNHQVHHRAQLALYLRMLGERLPEMYGPTADTKRPA